MDDEYIYEYNNTCLKQCPENTKLSVDEKKCLISCYENQFESNNMCYYGFLNDTKNIFQNGNIFINNNNSNFYNLINNVILSAYIPNENYSLTIQRNDDIIYKITNSKSELELLKNKSNNNKNLSIIDLGECETKLKIAYHINESDSLIFIKNEKINGKPNEKNIEFEVYEPYNKTKLNLSICDDTPIDIYVHMELSQETKQLEKFNFFI